jgi:acid phosphatase
MESVPPSQPNYIAPASGDTSGLNHDIFVLVNKNVSTIVDLLEDKGIGWGNYNRGLPYNGFQGYKYDAGLYERKHNPLAQFESVVLDPARLTNLKNSSM